MKPNDKAYQEAADEIRFNSGLDLSEDVCSELAKLAVDAAYASQFQSEDYAGLVKELREDVLQFNLKDTAYENIANEAADALEALLAERNALKAELAKAQEITRMQAERIGWYINEQEKRDAVLKPRASLAEAAAKERDALLARLGPVDDKELVEIAADAISTYVPDQVSKWGSIKDAAIDAIAAIRPHIEAAERERCAKIAETPELWLTDKPSRGCDDIAAAIRSGK